MIAGELNEVLYTYPTAAQAPQVLSDTLCLPGAVAYIDDSYGVVCLLHLYRPSLL